MGLTPEEQAELELIEATLGRSEPGRPEGTGLTPEEEAELELIELAQAQPRAEGDEPAPLPQSLSRQTPEKTGARTSHGILGAPLSQVMEEVRDGMELNRQAKEDEAYAELEAVTPELTEEERREVFAKEQEILESIVDGPSQVDRLVPEGVVRRIADAHGVDADWVRRSFRLHGKGVQKQDVSRLQEVTEMTLGRIGGSFGGFAPQLIARFTEGDEDKRAAMQDVARHVLEEQSGGQFAFDVATGALTGGLLARGAGMAAARVAPRAATPAVAGTVATEGALIGAAVAPGDEGKGAALGTALGMAPFAPAAARAGRERFRRILGKDDESLQAIMKMDDSPFAKAESRLNEPEVRAARQLFEDAEVRELLPGIVRHTDDAYSKFTAQYRNNRKFRDVIDDIVSVNPDADARTLQQIDDLWEVRIGQATDEPTKQRLSLVRDNQLEELQQARAVLGDSPEVRRQVLEMEMQALSIRGRPEEFLAYKRLQSMTRSFASHQARRNLGEAKLASASGLAKLQRETDRLLRQGRLTGEAYDDFIVMREMTNQLETRSAARLAEAGAEAYDPTQNLLRRWGQDLRYVASEVDSKLNVGLGSIIDDFYVGANRKATFSEEWGTKGDVIIRALRKEGVTWNTETSSKIGRALADPSRMSELTLAERQAARAFRGNFDDIREVMNAKGMHVPRMQDYLPQKLKPLNELTEAAQDRLQEVLQRLRSEIPDEATLTSTSLDVFRRVDDVYESTLHREVDELSDVIEAVTGEVLGSVEDLLRAAGSFEKLGRARAARVRDVSAALARKRDVPDWAREWNVDRLYLRYVDEAGTELGLSRPMQALLDRVDLLDRVGMKEASKYFAAYAENMQGIRRGLRATLEESPMLDAAFGGKAPYVREVFSAMTNTVYASHLGLSPRANLRNLTQPFYMTGADVATNSKSIAYGTELAFQGSAKSIAFQAARGPRFLSAAKTFLKERGLAPPTYKGEMESAMRAGIVDSMPKGLRTFRRAIDYIHEKSLALYSHTDYSNRLTTYFMSEDMARHMMDGVQSLSARETPSGAQASALRALGGFEPAAQVRMKRLLASDATHEEITQELAKYLISKTQLVYGTVGMNQWGRFTGPFFSMFTKWPTTIASELAYEYGRRGPTGGTLYVGEKYIAPALATWGKGALLREAGIDPQDSPRVAEFISRQGVVYYSPLYAGFDVANMVNTPALQMGGAGAAALGGLAKGGDLKPTSRLIRQLMNTHIPVYSPAVQASRRLYRVVQDERPDF